MIATDDINEYAMLTSLKSYFSKICTGYSNNGNDCKDCEIKHLCYALDTIPSDCEIYYANEIETTMYDKQRCFKEVEE